jgi:hypothetical protein
MAVPVAFSKMLGFELEDVYVFEDDFILGSMKYLQHVNWN